MSCDIRHAPPVGKVPTLPPLFAVPDDEQPLLVNAGLSSAGLSEAHRYVCDSWAPHSGGPHCQVTVTALLVAGLIVPIGASHIQNPAAASAARFGNHPWVRLTDG